MSVTGGLVDGGFIEDIVKLQRRWSGSFARAGYCCHTLQQIYIYIIFIYIEVHIYGTHRIHTHTYTRRRVFWYVQQG